MRHFRTVPFALGALLAGTLLAPWPQGAGAAGEKDKEAECEYVVLEFDEKTPLPLIMEYVKTAFAKSPKFNAGGRLKGFVYPDTFKQKTLNFSQSLKVPIPKGASDDLRAEVMLSLFYTLLEISDHSLIDRGTVFEIVEGKTRQKKPIRIYTQEEAATLPPDDVLVAQLYTFKNFDPARLSGIATTLLNTTAGESLLPIPDTRTVLLVAYASKMCELYKILERVDANTSEMEISYVELAHASATEIVPTITDIIKAREQAGGRQGAPTQRSQTAQVFPNPRTNKELILLATPEDAQDIRVLVKKLDQELTYATASVKFFPIKHRDANEVKTIIDSLYEERGKVTAPAGGRPPGFPPGLIPPPGAGAGQLLPQDIQSEEARSLFIAPRVVADTRNEATPSATGRGGLVGPAAAGQTSSGGGGTNLLIVIAPSERVLKDVEEIIEKVDRRKSLVLIEATVMELGPDASRDIGVELAAGDEAKPGTTRGAAVTGMGLSTLSPTSPPTRIPTAPASGLTGFLFKDSASRIPFLISLQESDSMTDVLACPKLLANDNETATFEIKRQEPYQKQETTTGGVITTSQAFAEASTVLEFTPSISLEGFHVRDEAGELLKDDQGNPILEERKYVRMKILQQIESFKGAAVFDGGTPPLESRKATTTVTILNSSTVAIGGFTSKNKRKTVNKVPFLGDIPILGFFFRRESTADTMTTLFIFITPTIIDDLRDLDNLADSFRNPSQFEELKQQYKSHFPPSSFEEDDAPEKDKKKTPAATQ